jgi:hypothetical protein
MVQDLGLEAMCGQCRSRLRPGHCSIRTGVNPIFGYQRGIPTGWQSTFSRDLVPRPQALEDSIRR